MGLSYNSVCSGIEAASHAVEPMGWEPVAFSEVDAVCNRFLAEVYPDVPNVGDMLSCDWRDYPANVLIGGTPCQTYTTMGRWRREIRADQDPRGKLAYRFLDIAEDTGADWFIWENVANVVTVDHGRFFKRWLQTAAKRGFDVGWRVLDTADFGLPTTRARLFAVGHRRDRGEIKDILFQPRNLVGSGLPAYPKRVRPKRADEEAHASYSIGFDGAGIGPRGRYETLPTLTKGHAGRFGLVTRGGRIRKITPLEAERAMGFSDGYTDAAGLSFRERHAVIGNSFSPRIIRALAWGIEQVT